MVVRWLALLKRGSKEEDKYGLYGVPLWTPDGFGGHGPDPGDVVLALTILVVSSLTL